MQFARATHAVFETNFLDQDNVPLTSGDPNSYPAVSIKDPNGTEVATGLGRTIGGGKYQFRWFVPENAEINVDTSSWKIVWFFLTATGHNRTNGDSFDIIEKIDPEPEERKWTYLTRMGTNERLFLRLDKAPVEICLDLLDTGNNLIHQVTSVTDDLKQAKECIALGARKIGRTHSNGQYLYFFNTDPLGVGEYLIFWKVRDTDVSPADSVQQMLRVPSMNFWRLVQPLRMLVDKLQKRIGWVQSYSDSDIYEYILRGVDAANMVQPTTNWTLSSIPIHGSRGVIDAVLLYAAMWALMAQQILEIELSFDHGGQTVQLNYNHDYSGILSTINDMLTRFQESKLHIYRQANGPGRVGVRPKNWRFTQRVWRVDNWGTGSPYDVSVLMTSINL